MRTSGWSRNLTPSQFERVVGEATEKSVEAGDVVAHMGAPVLHWTGVIDGLLKLSVMSAAGRSCTLAGVNVGGWFGEGSLMKREPRRYEVIALRPSRVALVPHATFEWLRLTSLPFCHHLQNLMNARLSLFVGMILYTRLLGADARVARCLATLFNPDLYVDPQPLLDLRQEEIGQLCGLTRQHVNITLQRLQRNALIRIEPRGVTVLDIEGLRNFGSMA